jgi:hypothetical protein
VTSDQVDPASELRNQNPMLTAAPTKSVSASTRRREKRATRRRLSSETASAKSAIKK